MIEKPYAWEYKFFAYVIKNEFNKLQKHRWDFKYGIFSGHVFERNPEALIDDISEKLNEIQNWLISWEYWLIVQFMMQ